MNQTKCINIRLGIIGAIVIGILMILILGGCGSFTKETPTPTPAEILQVVIVDDNAPFSYIDDETGEPAGFDIDLMNALAGSMGYQVEYQMVPYPSETDVKCNYEDDKLIGPDVHFSPFTHPIQQKTKYQVVSGPEYGKVFSFGSDLTIPFFNTSAVVIAKAGTELPSEGKATYLQYENVAIYNGDRNSGSVPFALGSVKGYADIDSLLDAVSTGEIDFAVLNYLDAYTKLKTGWSDLEIIGGSYNESFFEMVFCDEWLRSDTLKAFQLIIDDGTYKNILDKWLPGNNINLDDWIAED